MFQHIFFFLGNVNHDVTSGQTAYTGDYKSAAKFVMDLLSILSLKSPMGLLLTEILVPVFEVKLGFVFQKALI